MRIKAKTKNGITTVKAMAKHPMLTYKQAKKKGKEANFITHIKAEHSGDVVYEVSTSQFLSKNPYVKFRFKGGAKGDKLIMTWVDLSGKSKISSSKIK
jgi:sulfur-oxidizing protein SoxZ